MHSMERPIGGRRVGAGRGRRCWGRGGGYELGGAAALGKIFMPLFGGICAPIQVVFCVEPNIGELGGFAVFAHHFP